MIAIFGEFDFLAQEFQITGIDGTRQIIHLIASIIDVVFAFHRVTCRPQKVHKCRTCSSAAAMTDMQQPRGVGADVFHLNLRCIFFRQLAIAFARFKDFLEGIVEHIALQIKVQKARAGNLGMVEPVALDALHQFFCNLTRCLMEYACRLHGKVGSKITELLLGRYFQNNLGQFPFREYTISNGAFSRCFNGFCQCVFNIQSKVLLIICLFGTHYYIQFIVALQVFIEE